MKPGDEMGLYLYNNPGTWEYLFFKVIDRKDYGNDSMHMTYFRGRHFAKNMAWLNEYDTFGITYKELNKPYFAGFDTRDTVTYYYGPKDTLKQKPYFWDIFNDSAYKDSCNTLINKRYTFSGSILSGESSRTETAYKGMGVVYERYAYDSWQPDEYKEKFTYYIKDGHLCGVKDGFPVSIKDKTSLKGVHIAPNPASEFMLITSEQPADYTIYDLLGKPVMKGVVDNKAQLNITELPTGLYVIVVESGNNPSCQTLIVE